MKSIKPFNNKDNKKIPKISLIKVNKKGNFNTANIFIKKQKNKEKKLVNQTNDFSSSINPKLNNDYIPSHRIKQITLNSDISNDEINIMKIKMSCNILNHKINQLRNFSKEIDSHSFDNIKYNISTTDNINIQNKNEYLKRKDNYLSYMSNQHKANQNNKFNNIDMSYSSKKYYLNHKVSFNDENSFNGVNKINVNNKKKYSFTNYNNHIDNINKISKINKIGINNNAVRRKNISKVFRQNETDINLYNDIERFNETERQLKNIPALIKSEKLDNIGFIINKKINFDQKEQKLKQPFYNKIFNNNNIFHKRFNSHGINNISGINYQSQNIEINQYKNSINNENTQKIKYYEKKNENKNKSRVGYFDSFFIKNKNLYFIENSCNYNIVNQNSTEKIINNNMDNNFQIQESSKLTYFTSNNKIANNNINTDNIFNNEKNQKSFDIKNKNNLIQIYSNNFSINGEIKEGEEKSSNYKSKDNNFKSNFIINSINNTEIKSKEKEKLNTEISEKGNKKGEKISKDNKIINDNINNDSITERDDIIINSEKDSISSSIMNRYNTDGKIIPSNWDKEKEIKKDNIPIKNLKKPNINRIFLTEENKKEKEKDESPSKSEEEIIKIILAKIKQNKDISKKIEKEKKKMSKKSVFFDNNQTNYILYDLNKPATKIMIYNNKGKTKRFIPMKLNEYINRIKYSNVSKYKKKPNLKNYIKINYKKIIEDTNKLTKNKTNNKANRLKKTKISPGKKYIKNTNKSLEWKNHIYSICDSIIKSIDPLSVTERNLNLNKNDIFGFSRNKNNNFIRKNKLLKSYENISRKKNKNIEKNNSFDLKRKKAKEKILNAIDDIKKYFEEIY